MKRPKMPLLTTLLLIIGLLVRATPVKAVSNEIGNYRDTVYYTALTGSADNTNIIDQSLNGWNFITHTPVYGIRATFNKTIDFNEGDIVSFSYILVNTEPITDVLDATSPKPPTCLTSSWLYTVISCDVQMSNMQSTSMTIKDANFSNGSTVTNFYFETLNYETIKDYANVYYFQYKVRTTQKGPRNYLELYSNFSVGKPWAVRFSNFAINTSLEDGAIQANEQQQQAGQQAQQDGQQGSSSSQTDATQGTQSLLNAITGFVGVISNATPTNCRITGDMGALDLGQLDFCADNPPAIIQVIGSLILIGVTIPIVIWTVKKIISMFRSFTNG